MNVLIACEYSGVVREAFRKRGHNAWSCDILDAEDGSPYHYKVDVMEVLDAFNPIRSKSPFDLMIAHPPCTYLTVAGNKWYADRPDLYEPAYEFVMQLARTPIERICIENPPGRLSRMWRKPDQYVQPYWFGDAFKKKTGLWLKNLPPLVPTNMVEPPPDHVTSGGKKIATWYSNNKKMRDRTFQGMAEAMAEQWD